MNAKVPTVKQTNWISIIPHLLIMSVIILIWHQFNPEKAFLIRSNDLFGNIFFFKKLNTKRPQKKKKKK